MATQFKIRDVEQAILAALKANAAFANVQVSGLSSKDWDEQGNLVPNPPAVLVLFEQAEDTSLRDVNRTGYSAGYTFALFCGALDMSGPDNERNSCYGLIAAVRAAMAGQRLSIDGGAASTQPVLLIGVSPVEFGNDGVWYAVRIRVESIAQFG